MNNYKASSKILFSIIVAIIVVSWSLSAAITNVYIQKAMALAATTTNTAFGLQGPLYTEYDKPTIQKAVVVNGTHASSLSFSGHGTANGVNFTDSGKALIISRGSSIIVGKGQAAMMTSSGDKTSLTFEEIGHLDANGTITASGASFFDANATGKLAFLGNTVAIYKDQIYKDAK